MRWIVALMMGAGSFLLVMLTIDEPGLTIDEPINVGHGKRMMVAVEACMDRRTLPDPETVDWLFRSGHEHPPLTRLAVGWAHGFQDPEPADPAAIVPRAGRPASAVALAILVALAVIWGWRFTGWVGGSAAGLFTLTMPRLFGHAHLASPEVLSAVGVLAGLSAVGWMLDQSGDPSVGRRWLRILWAGFWVGIAMLTKLTAVLLPLAVILLMAFRRQFVALCVVGLVALVVMVLGWPWLWPIELPGYSPGIAGTWERLREFFLVGVDRVPIYVQYLGTQYPNKLGQAPWHFVWLFFLWTTPIATHLFGIAGLAGLNSRKRRLASGGLLVTLIAVILGVFTLPIARYDSERLFLVVFPLWAIVAGVGVGAVVGWFRPSLRGWVVGCVAVLIAVEGSALLSERPFWLSYFNPCAGGLAGATELGLEPTYWGDTLTQPVFDALEERAKRGDRVVLIPSLYAGHALYSTTSALARQSITIEPADDGSVRAARWAIAFHRTGYLNDSLPRDVLERGEVVFELERDGVWLARLYRLEPIESR